ALEEVRHVQVAGVDRAPLRVELDAFGESAFGQAVADLDRHGGSPGGGRKRERGGWATSPPKSKPSRAGDSKPLRHKGFVDIVNPSLEGGEPGCRSPQSPTKNAA